MRVLYLLSVSVFLLATVAIMVWLGWGKRSDNFGERDAAYWAKFKAVNALENIGKARPYTEQEMKFLRDAINDPHHSIRVEAIAALAQANRDPIQRKEAIKLITERLKDHKWIVRSYAVWALGKLNARESIPHILPLLKDPQPEVREDAMKCLQRLGYKVGE